MKTNQFMHTQLTKREAKLLLEVLYEGMPDIQRRRDELARFARRLKEELEIKKS